jgi:hypothetical protein
MGQIYRGYSIMPAPNDPGVIIRQILDNGDVVVGQALNFVLAQAWVDAQLAARK